MPDPYFRDVGKVFVIYGETCAECACPAEPLPGCLAAGKGRLAIDERKPGKEKLTLALGKLAAASDPRDLGDPAGGETRFDVCLYRAAGARVGALAIDRGGEVCGAKPCWKALRGGFKYADPAGAASGVATLLAKSGAAGKGKLSLKARNDAGRGLSALPTGLTGALAGATGATIQVVASDGACFELAATRIKRAEAARFDASAP